MIELINHGIEQAARPDAATICRLGDGAIAQYQATSAAIAALLDRFKVSKALAEWIDLILERQELEDFEGLDPFEDRYDYEGDF